MVSLLLHSHKIKILVAYLAAIFVSINQEKIILDKMEINL